MKYNKRRVNRKKRVARRNPGAGELIIMGNPRRKRNKRRRRASNPHRRRYSMKNARRHRSYRRRRNPAINRGMLELTLAGGVGAVATRAGVQALLGDKNAGAMGYGANVIAALGLGFVGDKFGGGNIGQGLMLGGLIATVLRIAKEQFFASSPLAAQLSLQGLGDADFALSGYVNDPFTLPTTSEGPDQLTITPNRYWERPVIVAGAKGLNGYDTGALGGRAAGVIDRWKTTWG